MLGIDSVPVSHQVPPHSRMDHDLVDTCWCCPDYDIRHDRVVVLHKSDDRWLRKEIIPLAPLRDSTICTAHTK